MVAGGEAAATLAPWLATRPSDAPPLRLLRPADAPPAAAADDDETAASHRAAFDASSASLAALGASADEVHAAWRVLGAVLALGELAFSEEGEAAAPNAAATDEGKATLLEASEAALDAAAAMLGVEAIGLRKRLLSRTVHTGRGSNYVIRYSVGAALNARDGALLGLLGRRIR